MKKGYLYCDKRSLNDATNFYIEVIVSCLDKLGYNVKTVHKLKEIKKPDLIFTVTERYYLVAKTRHPLTKAIYWAQGVGPEETTFLPRKIVRTVSEFVMARTVDCLFAVSDALVQHFRRKYGFKGNSYVVMPCFNIEKPLLSFNTAQYEKPSFVYAGGASAWQCVDEMLDSYKIIEDKIKDATLAILSGQKEIFEEKIKSRGIKNYTVKYVKQNELAEELSHYKYGFMLRHDNTVNNVATPTKLNGYLCSYLIPIMTDAILDFNTKIELGDFKISTPCPFTPKEVAEDIIAFESKMHDFSGYEKIVTEIFESYYNLAAYKNTISAKLKQFL